MIRNAEAIAIFVGAGMGVDSGFEQYRGESGFWTKDISIKGKSIKYQDLMQHMAFEEMPNQAWVFIASLLEKYSETKPHDGFDKLLELIKNKEYFIVTIRNASENFIENEYPLIRINPLDSETSLINHISDPLAAKESIERIYELIKY